MIYRVGDTYALVKGNGPLFHRWLIAGLHGEEPAPVAALAAMLPDLETLPGYVVLPLANPTGLALHSRFGVRGVRDGHDFVEAMRTLAEAYAPDLVLDLHEDDELTGGVYIYHHGQNDEVPAYFLEAFKREHVDLLGHGYPRFSDQEVVDGLVIQQQNDNSIDEDLRDFGAEVLVVETPTTWDIEKRIGIHKLAIELALRWPGGD